MVVRVVVKGEGVGLDVVCELKCWEAGGESCFIVGKEEARKSGGESSKTPIALVILPFLIGCFGR